MEHIPITRHFRCLVLNVFHIHRILETINLTQKLSCVFLYDTVKNIKGYKCFHPPSCKFFISRHVVFDETVFPFKSSLFSTATSYVLNIFDSWIPFSNTSLETDALQ